MKKIYLFMLCLLGVAGMAMAQTAVENPKSDNTWTLLKESAGVKIYGALSKCGDQNVVNLKIDNQGIVDIMVSWKMPAGTLSTSPGNNQGNTQEISVNVKSKETVFGACNSMNLPQLRLYTADSKLPEIEFTITQFNK